MRPNIAQDAPPISIEVGGHPYPCATDFRVWIDVLDKMRSINLDASSAEKRIKAAEQIEDIEEIIFGGVLADESLSDVFAGINKFAAGYPSAPISASDDNGLRTFSFNYDLNEIVIAIRDQHGVDLTYKNPAGCHWWEFLLLFHTLAGDHYILNLMQARGYKGKDKDMIKRRNACALPYEMDAEDIEALDAFDALFEHAGEEQSNDN